MDATRFDQVTRTLTTGSSRRGVVRVLASAALGVVATRLPGSAEARKKKRKKPTLNAFGCADVGQPCGGNDDVCCSGICGGKKPKKGKQDKRRCVAHNADVCEAGDDTCQDVNVACGGQGGAYCFRTSGNAGFCGKIIGGQCAICARDTECEATHGPGAACVVCPSSCPDTNTACIKAVA